MLDVSTAAARAINHQQRARKEGALNEHDHNDSDHRDRMRGEGASSWMVKERLDLRRDPVRTVIEETLLLGDV